MLSPMINRAWGVEKMNAVPKTLLQMAGAPTTPGRLDEAVLVLIDYQREYVSGGLPLPDADRAIAEAAALLETARRAGTPVIHVVHHGGPGGALFDPEKTLAGIDDRLTPRAGEAVVLKSLPDSFAGTDLAALVSATGRRELILAGFMTHMCVSATARTALNLGLRTTVVADACATRDLPNPLGGVLPATTIHAAALGALADRFAIVVRDVTALDAG